MTRRKEAEEAELEPASIVSGPGLFPAKPRRVVPGVGARGVRSEPVTELPTFTAAEAAAVSDRFPSGEAAFAHWMLKRGVGPKVKRTFAEWEADLIEFAERLVLGHRRRLDNGNHRHRTR